MQSLFVAVALALPIAWGSVAYAQGPVDPRDTYGEPDDWPAEGSDAEWEREWDEQHPSAGGWKTPPEDRTATNALAVVVVGGTILTLVGVPIYVAILGRKLRKQEREQSESGSVDRPRGP